MTNNGYSPSGQVSHSGSSRDVFLTLPEVAARYRWGRTKTFHMRRSSGFPVALGGVYRLDTLQAWEDGMLAAGVDPSRAMPTPRSAKQDEIPELPERKRPGRQRGAQEAAK